MSEETGYGGFAHRSSCRNTKRWGTERKLGGRSVDTDSDHIYGRTMSIDTSSDDRLAEDVAPEDRPPDEPVARLVHPRAIRWLHWINFPLLIVMIWSGLRIYWAEDVYALGIGSWQWFAFFPDAVYETFGLERRLARGMAFHFAFGWLFVANGAIYLAYLLATKEWRHILPDRHAAKDAKDVVLHDLHLRRDLPPQGKYNAAQRISYTVVLLMALIVVVSGFAIYKPTQLYPLPLLFGGYQGARLVHFWMTIGLSLFFVVHLLQVARAGWGNFRSMVTGYVVERSPSSAPQDTPADVDTIGARNVPESGTDRARIGDPA
jgi:thiosulfate reductase cytochrome b subunit